MAAEKTFATLPRTTRGMPVALTASPDGQTIVYTNGNSIIMRNVQVRICAVLMSLYSTTPDRRHRYATSTLSTRIRPP